MRKVIFVTTVKPFNEVFKFRQLNAIQSWLLLKNIEKEIFILTEEDIENEIVKLKDYNNNVHIINEFEKSPSTGIPTFRSLYLKAANEIKSENDIICQINADMILFDDFSNTLNEILDQINSRKFCFIGQRTSWNKPSQINFEETNWDINLINFLKINGQLNPACAIDYFVCSEKTFENIPDFYIARMKYDNWLVSHAISNNEFTIDVTNTVFSVHQDHQYGENGDLNFNNFISSVNADFQKNSELSNQFSDIKNCKIYSDFIDNKIVTKYR